jgi:hypothetical protein
MPAIRHMQDCKIEWFGYVTDCMVDVVSVCAVFYTGSYIYKKRLCYNKFDNLTGTKYAIVLLKRDQNAEKRRGAVV